MSSKLIDQMKIKGLTYIGKINGEDLFCNFYNYDSINYLFHFVKDFSIFPYYEMNEVLKRENTKYQFFKETTGNKNVVMYNTDLFEIKSDDYGTYLHFCNKDYVELPIGSSSCYKMFYECELNPFLDFRNFDFSEIKETNYMFSGCRLKDGQVLNPIWTPSEVLAYFRDNQIVKKSSVF